MKFMLDPVPPKLERELAAFAKQRVAPLDLTRRNGQCAEITSSNDRNNALRFLGYLQQQGKTIESVFPVFASPRLAPAVQRYAECLVQERGLKYKSVAVYLISIANIARWCHAMIKRNGGEAAARLDNSVLDELDSLHRQCKAQARKQDAFDTDTPINWLTWEECQTSRVIAETKCLHAGSAPSLDMLHDVCLLTILTYQPPDRVGLMRTLGWAGV